MKRRALIIGSGGQDGQLLQQHLVEKGYEWLGIERHCIQGPGHAAFDTVDICHPGQVMRLLAQYRPDEIYHLAAHHHSSEEQTPQMLDIFEKSWGIHVRSLLNFLEAMRAETPSARLFYAASSRVFGSPSGELQDENCPIAPICPYGITKAAGMQICHYYRTHHRIYAAVGILFNHESHLRRPIFLSKKIITGALAIRQGLSNNLILGSLESEADWSYARDIVDAMHRMLQLPEPDTFIVASGKKHSVRDFVQTAFSLLGLDWRNHVAEKEGLLREKRKPVIGNPGKLARLSGWRPSLTFEEMVRQLVIDEGGGNYLA